MSEDDGVSDPAVQIGYESLKVTISRQNHLILVFSSISFWTIYASTMSSIRSHRLLPAQVIAAGHIRQYFGFRINPVLQLKTRLESSFLSLEKGGFRDMLLLNGMLGIDKP